MILTRDQVAAHAKGARLEVPAGTLVTSLARDEAEARGIAIVEVSGSRAIAGPTGSCGCGAAGACACSPPSAAASSPGPGGARSDWSDRLGARRGADPTLWRAAARPSGAAGAAGAAGTNPAAAAAAREARSRVLGPAETHVDACAMGGECREDIVVVTAVGRNRPHVLAELAQGIAEVGGDIQEISQRIVDGWFHTILTVDMSRAPGKFPEAKTALEGLSREDDYTVRVQHERVFRYMHRI